MFSLVRIMFNMRIYIVNACYVKSNWTYW